MTKLITAYKTFPADLKEVLEDAMHTGASAIAMVSFVLTVCLWAQAIAERIN